MGAACSVPAGEGSAMGRIYRRLSSQKSFPSRSPFFRDGGRPLVLGHRGMPRLHQENTIAALDACVEHGIDGVEIDVYVTTDNKVVLFHDEDTERLTGVKGCIADMPWADVMLMRIQQEIDATGQGQKKVKFPAAQKIPLLSEVLLRFKDKLKINVEMKAYKPMWERRHWGTEVAKVIRECEAEKSVVVTSFDFFMLRELEREYPGLHSGFAYDDAMSNALASASTEWYDTTKGGSQIEDEPLDKVKDSVGFVRWIMESNLVGKIIGSTVVDLEWSVLDGNTVQRFHDRGTTVGVYCLYPYDTTHVKQILTKEEELAMLKRLCDHKVDWIETDDPRRLMSDLDEIYGAIGHV